VIVARLQGGLGNQMFQYAAGRALAARWGVPLRLDVSGFPDVRGRECHIFRYPVAARQAEPAEVAAFPPAPPPRGRVARWAGALAAYARAPRPAMGVPVTFCEGPGRGLAQFRALGDRVYLQGYWQSEAYFSGIAEEVARELTFLAPYAGANAALAAHIQDTRSVSVHVRRGDYVTDPELAGLYAELTPAWYARAVATACEGLDDAHVFLFSDDLDWARDNLDLPHPVTCVEGNAGAPWEDIRLMSLCRRHVIANSSFSWWGAWLDRRPDSVVVGPRQWFGPRRAARRSRDICPARWRLV
jgi:hypothetical protein